jgi:excinuclease ABC subunit B
MKYEKKFIIESPHKPTGDQPKAIKSLVDTIIENKDNKQVLLGVTGSGKTFTMANVIQELNRPALVIAHNKTLAAQLYSEFKALFPENTVEYFVSYYDYYQPEAYIPGKDIYIEKSSLINEEIDRMRLSATKALFERNDVIIVASVSSIYGLGSAEAYYDMLLFLETDMDYDIEKISKKLVQINYRNNTVAFERGDFRILGDVLEIFPAYEEKNAIRIEFFGNTIESIYEIDSLTKKEIKQLEKIAIYPATHFTTDQHMVARAIKSIQEELLSELPKLKAQGKLLEHQRLEERVKYDIEMIEQTGSCGGIENYSRHFTGRLPGDPPPTLLDYFPKDYLLFIDESHVMIPQLRGMYNGDKARKTTLVEFGFRLPSALDNRPLKFEEFEDRMGTTIFVSATPSSYEIDECDNIVQQIIRPTGLLDPEIEIRPIKGQVDDLYGEIADIVKKNEKILVTTLTKKMAEHLTEYYQDLGVRVRYMHSDIDTMGRIKIIADFEDDLFDVLVGINLLREGLDLPSVSLVAILDADKEGFLRSEKSLIQTCGRAARNINGRVIMYGDKITNSMAYTIKETERRRKIQEKYNKKHNITPKSIIKEKRDSFDLKKEIKEEFSKKEDLEKEIKTLETNMRSHAKKLEFEKAAEARDRIEMLKKILLEI